jgi:hypothetical protein
MKLNNQISINQAALQQSGLYIMAGGLMLVIEFILLQFNLVVVELPDRRIDTLSIALAIAAWILLLAGVKILSASGLLQHKRKLFWIPITGLVLYTLGCFAIVFEQWTLIIVVPLGLLLTATGMLVLGGVLLKEKTGPGRVSVALLLVGLYPFLCMFPIVAFTGAPNYSVNYFWGVLWVILGCCLRIKSYSR